MQGVDTAMALKFGQEYKDLGQGHTPLSTVGAYADEAREALVKIALAFLAAKAAKDAFEDLVSED